MTDDRLPTVLVVDDEPINIEILAEILGELYEIVFATSGTEALEMASSLHPDLILLDVVMPDMDGYEVCARLQELPRVADIPLIFVTSQDDYLAELRGLELGAVDYISKPISPPVVKVRVRNQIELKIARENMARLADTDGLTGLYNRRYFDQMLSGECSRLSRSQGCLSLILLDVDFFKQFNDTYGHQAGDDCLRGIGDVVQATLKRACDRGARYGGEEFACILPETDHIGAVRVAEELRATIAALMIPHATSPVAPYVTVSLGVVTDYGVTECLPQHLVALADKHLYAAKAAGRNLVCAAENGEEGRVKGERKP